MARAWIALFLGPMGVTFSFATGATITKDVKAWDTIANIKAQVYITGSDLIFAGQVLQDDRTLSDYNIQNKSTLHVVMRRSRTPDPYTHVEPPIPPVRYVSQAEFEAQWRWRE